MVRSGKMFERKALCRALVISTCTQHQATNFKKLTSKDFVH
jgi:hypothetical protein